ncbi:hypothetical protein RHSIM_Rhsim04G0195300 [Rhododendron simsii]|uniref:F-box domain-containing protein n=1 Tax=Rhododendron simsii TaxID=118357 RepID=A0A834H0P6_RHOSS|nr:hypothetical protein RHSIM_Rhsim04G0195300 [Rhododendron simsii]
MMELGSPNQRNEKFQAKTVTLLLHIPYDIILNILSRTPVKSLLRFRCVSKSWCALISDPKFNLSIQRRKIVAIRKYHGSFPVCLIDDEASVTELPEPEPLTDLKPLMDSIPVMDGRLRSGSYDVVLEYKSGRKVPSEFLFPCRTLGIGAVVLEESLVSPPWYEWEEEEYTEILLSGATLKWKRRDDQFILIDS